MSYMQIMIIKLPILRQTVFLEHKQARAFDECGEQLFFFHHRRDIDENTDGQRREYRTDLLPEACKFASVPFGQSFDLAFVGKAIYAVIGVHDSISFAFCFHRYTSGIPVVSQVRC